MQKILIVDDDAAIRDTLSSILELQEYEVEAYATARQGREALENQTYASILIDIFLPDQNGIDFIKDIQNRGIQTPIIIITGHSEIELARQAVRLGVFDYLVKPFRSNQLQQVVRLAINHNYLIEEKAALAEQNRMYQQELEKLVDQKVSELRESEVKYQSLIEQSLVGVYIIQNDKLRYVNQKFAGIFGYTQSDIINRKHLIDFAIEEQKEVLKANLARLTKGSPLTFHFTGRTQKGEERILEVWGSLITYEDASAVEGMVLDITDRHLTKIRERQLELELLNEHKLSAIGRLAAGIAHNLNTPISVIQANAELLQVKNPDSPQIQKILNQTERLSELIRNIVQKSERQQDNKRTNIQLNQLLQEEIEFLQANLFFKHKINKSLQFDEHLPKVEGIYSDFSQSILAIIQNAIEAMYESDEKSLTVQTEHDEHNIYIIIEDTGAGISAANLNKVFDPFFSTKSRQRKNHAAPDQPLGTGLGLSLVYKLMRPYGVSFDIQSQEGRGTRFTLTIPYKKEKHSE